MHISSFTDVDMASEINFLILCGYFELGGTGTVYPTIMCMKVYTSI